MQLSALPRSWWLMLTVKVANRLRATRSAEPGKPPALTCKGSYLAEERIFATVDELLTKPNKGM